MTEREIRSPRGTELSCRSWPQEAAMRMLMNNLDPDVAERPEDLVVYGGTGRAARSWRRTTRSCERCTTLARRRDAAGAVGEAGRRLPDARHGAAGVDLELDAGAEMGGLGHVPRARGGRAHDVRADDGRSWIYIGTQGILQGTYETLAECARQRFGDTLAGHDHADGRIGRDGRRPTAGRHHERRRRALRRRRPHADRAAHQDALPRSRDRRPRDGVGVDRGGACRR